MLLLVSLHLGSRAFYFQIENRKIVPKHNTFGQNNLNIVTAYQLRGGPDTTPPFN